MTSNAKKFGAMKRKIWVYACLGIIVLLILLTTLAIAGQEQILRCERSNNGNPSCLIQKNILGLIVLRSRTTEGVRAISIGQNCVGSDCKFRLELYSDQGIVPVSDSYTSNYNQLLDAFNRFNTFFSNTSNTNMQLKMETNPILIVGISAVSVLIWIFLGYLGLQAKREVG